MPIADAQRREDQSRDEEPGDQVARLRIRVVLTGSAVLVALVLLLPVLTSFTSVLDGVVGGVGVAYIAGFAEFVLAMSGAVVYCRWINRIEADTEQRGGDPR